MQATTITKVKSLVLDAGPLLALTPLRGLAERYLTVPQVLEELKDKRAQEYLEKLALTAGVHIEVLNPDIQSLSTVTAFAKKTGDYSVLSHADLCVLALTYAVNEEVKAQKGDETEAGSSKFISENTIVNAPTAQDSLEEVANILNKTRLDKDDDSDLSTSPSENEPDQAVKPASANPPDLDDDVVPLFDDPSSEEDDGEGEWITPTNVALHKSRALELLPADEAPNRTRRGKGRSEATEAQLITTGCMTADFAMQNVLLQMGLNLIGIEGKRIDRVKTWILRCHACFKICKDPSKKFCPSCGNPTLLRTSVTVAASPNGQPTLQVHLKKNFQWRNRGSKYSIPAPKPGTSKTGPGEGLILREDQSEWIRAEKRAEGRKFKEEKKMISSLKSGTGIKLDWNDPDWLPEMLVVGAGGKGRSGKGDMPSVGYGRKNPNERKRRKR